jgi:GNAT superfamily N-acetyltransferase
VAQPGSAHASGAWGRWFKSSRPDHFFIFKAGAKLICLAPAFLLLDLHRSLLVQMESAMEIKIKQDCAGVDWKAVAEILKLAGMAHHEPEMHKKAFEASHTVVFVYQAGRLIGFGRAISDGVYQAALYDFAVLPEFQGKGIGGAILQTVMSGIPHCNAILYASPGKEGFYQKCGFRKMKTGMARFLKGESMRERGFTE